MHPRTKLGDMMSAGRFAALAFVTAFGASCATAFGWKEFTPPGGSNDDGTPGTPLSEWTYNDSAALCANIQRELQNRDAQGLASGFRWTAAGAGVVGGVAATAYVVSLASSLTTPEAGITGKDITTWVAAGAGVVAGGSLVISEYWDGVGKENIVAAEGASAQKLAIETFAKAAQIADAATDEAPPTAVKVGEDCYNIMQNRKSLKHDQTTALIERFKREADEALKKAEREKEKKAVANKNLKELGARLCAQVDAASAVGCNSEVSDKLLESK
jgi:hypothetical protein